MSTKPHQILWSISRLVFTIAILLNLLVNVPVAQAQPTVTLSIDSASVDKLGVVTVNVTLTCSEPILLGDPSANSIGVVVRQPYKRIYTIIGQGGVFGLTECNGSTQYAVQVIADPGKFGSGIAYIYAQVQLCDIDSNCVFAEDFFNTRIH